ncbi:hypothetical protein [Bradyrhizobium sp. B117]|uniref:hypothetical protein n=1 Tax=Bradyrhizobium sp. B117 TaxID=3140246 RepID=UPI00318456A5
MAARVVSPPQPGQNHGADLVLCDDGAAAFECRLEYRLQCGTAVLSRRASQLADEADRHPIHAAVRMVVAGEDPFATHLLIQSADKLLIDLAQYSPPKELAMDWSKLIKPDYKQALLKVFRETSNFLKHADRDHSETPHVGDIATSNALQLAACIANYWALFFVRSLPEKGIHHFGLADGANQKIYVAPRHHHHVAAGFEPRVLPDGMHIPVDVAQSTLAGRVNQPAFIGFLEVQRKQPVEG